MSCQNW